MPARGIHDKGAWGPGPALRYSLTQARVKRAIYPEMDNGVALIAMKWWLYEGPQRVQERDQETKKNDQKMHNCP